MKNYQFATFAAVGLIIAAALWFGKKKKPCGCGGHSTTADTPVQVVTEGE